MQEYTIRSAYIHTVHVDVVHIHLTHIHSANLGRPSIQGANLCQLQWDHDTQLIPSYKFNVAGETALFPALRAPGAVLQHYTQK